jgi:hypothetical protein
VDRMVDGTQAVYESFFSPSAEGQLAGSSRSLFSRKRRSGS